MTSQELSHSSLFDDAPEGFARRISLTSGVDNEATNSVCDPQANGSPPLIARDGSAGSHVDLAPEGSVTFASETNTELANLVSPEHASTHSSKPRTPPSPYIPPPSENNRTRTSYASRDEAVTPQMPPPLVTKRTTPLLTRSNPSSRPESNGHSNSYSPSRRSHHDFQEALKVDELAAKVETLTKVLGEREAQNVTLTSKLEELEKENDRLRRQLEAGGHLPAEENSEKYQQLWEEKEALEVELRAIRRVAEEEEEEKEEKAVEQRASVGFEFDKNDPNLLRRKIEDLQAQVHDLQEANESTSVMLSAYRSGVAPGKAGHEATPDPLLFAQEARHSQHRHDASAGALRREIESLRADLDALRHRNEVVVAENEALRRQGSAHPNVHRRDILATAERYSRAPFRSASRADNRGGHLDLQRHQRELEGDLEAMQRLREQIREEQQHSASLRAGGHMKSMSYANLSSFENDFRSPYSLQRSFFSPGEDFGGSSRRLAPGSGGGGGPPLDIRQRSSSVEPRPMRRESREERPSSSTAKEERPPADARSSGSTSSILSDAERELEDMKRVTGAFDGAEVTALRRSAARSPPLPLPPAGLRSVSPPPLPTQQNRTMLSKAGYRPDESRSAMFSISGRHPFAPRNAAEVQLGDVVKFTRQGGRICKGVVHFVGHLPGRNDVYIGVELEHEDGKHDGTYEGRRYFQCKTNKGVFVAFNKIVMCYGMRPF